MYPIITGRDNNSARKPQPAKPGQHADGTDKDGHGRGRGGVAARISSGNRCQHGGGDQRGARFWTHRQLP
jgi:hypothetical protein